MDETNKPNTTNSKGVEFAKALLRDGLTHSVGIYYPHIDQIH
ncbi:hypothetical protein [Belliella aquatica]|nr:hypothetical protein [Belliella aquatica]